MEIDLNVPKFCFMNVVNQFQDTLSSTGTRSNAGGESRCASTGLPKSQIDRKYNFFRVLIILYFRGSLISSVTRTIRIRPWTLVTLRLGEIVIYLYRKSVPFIFLTNTVEHDQMWPGKFRGRQKFVRHANDTDR